MCISPVGTFLRAPSTCQATHPWSALLLALSQHQTRHLPLLAAEVEIVSEQPWRLGTKKNEGLKKTGVSKKKTRFLKKKKMSSQTRDGVWAQIHTTSSRKEKHW
jgi:hypothetical protein